MNVFWFLYSSPVRTKQDSLGCQFGLWETRINIFWQFTDQTTHLLIEKIINKIISRSPNTNINTYVRYEYTDIFLHVTSVLNTQKPDRRATPLPVTLGLSAGDSCAYLRPYSANQWNDLQLLCAGRRPQWRKATSLPISGRLMKLTKSGRSELTWLINYLYEAE